MELSKEILLDIKSKLDGVVEAYVEAEVGITKEMLVSRVTMHQNVGDINFKDNEVKLSNELVIMVVVNNEQGSQTLFSTVIVSPTLETLKDLLAESIPNKDDVVKQLTAQKQAMQQQQQAM